MNDRAHAARSGGKLLVDALKVHGADAVFCVPGESYLAALDAFHDHRDIRLIVCRQEGGVANMAEAYGKLTGRPGIAFVTRGPGATNASVGVHTGKQDSTPMILFIGQVGSDAVEREAFQEVDFRRMFGPLSKWVASIDRPDRVPEFVSRAFHTAVAGRPGPVVLALPEDMLTDTAAVADTAPYKRVAAHAGAEDMHRLRTLLAQANKPLVVLGGNGWSSEACEDIKTFIAANNLPAAAAFRRQDLLDNRDPHYVGDIAVGMNPALQARVRDCDLLLVIGARMGEFTTNGYTLLDVPCPRQKLIHVHAGVEELGRVYQAELPINAGMPEFSAAAKALAPVDAKAWEAWTAQARGDFERWQQPTSMPGAVNLAEIMMILNRRMPPETIVTNDAGNFAIWVHRFYRYTGFRTQLAPTSGAMGYGVPSAVAAKLVHPDRPVLAFCGDGGFMMTGQELATAVQYDLPIVVLVINNGMYGTIRMHQEREYPGRIAGTGLRNPDFPALARAYGAHGELVCATSEFEPALERALTSGKSAVIEIRIDPDAITPRATLSGIRAEALKTKA
ncbi:MAG: thiamine pyrophosphate-binding protein [Burkholderiales bacterium]|nr:thiamine pyrophosphate-binding protein [Burkholderiales bacterium]